MTLIYDSNSNLHRIQSELSDYVEEQYSLKTYDDILSIFVDKNEVRDNYDKAITELDLSYDYLASCDYGNYVLIKLSTPKSYFIYNHNFKGKISTLAATYIGSLNNIINFLKNNTND